MDENPGLRIQFGLKALLALVFIAAIGAALYRAMDDGYRSLSHIVRAEHRDFELVRGTDCPGPFLTLGVWRFPKGRTIGGGVEGSKSFNFPIEPNADTRVLGLKNKYGDLTFVQLRRRQYERYEKYAQH